MDFNNTPKPQLKDEYWSKDIEIKLITKLKMFDQVASFINSSRSSEN